MKYQQEIDIEIRRQAFRLVGRCNALFELPRLVYAQIIEDNTLRKRPYRVSYERIQRIIHEMPELLEKRKET